MLEIFEDKNLQTESKRGILVGLDTGADALFAHSMEELCALTNACDIEVVQSFVQNNPHPNPATFIGSGKAMEIATFCEENEIGYCIFEDTLSPAQLRNLGKMLPVQIYDRTGLILEIFKRRAKTREARLQVESAQLQYMMPRLIGLWEAIGRQGGASGSMSNKGVGETQLELDRRLIQRRISELRRELSAIEHDRSIQRSKRTRSDLPLVSLVGYTNSGKSTLMNKLLARSGEPAFEEKQVFEKDMLFATLDTYVRRISLPDKMDFLLSDTVGFISKLPHQLVKAFHSTLEEAAHADLLLEVVDLSDPYHKEQMEVTSATLKELGCETIPRIFVMNKADLCLVDDAYPFRRDNTITISARDDKSLDALLSMIRETVYAQNRTVTLLFPYTEGSAVSELNDHAHILSQEYLPEGIKITANTPAKLLGKYSGYILES